MKICNICKIKKEVSEFYIQNGYVYAECKSCFNARCMKRKPHRKESTKKNQRNYYLKKNFGIDLEEYNKIFAEQKGKCRICGKHQTELKRALAVDHDHETEIVRGLLCGRCNLGLGYFKDNTELMKKAIKYLED